MVAAGRIWRNDTPVSTDTPYSARFATHERAVVHAVQRQEREHDAIMSSRPNDSMRRRCAPTSGAFNRASTMTCRWTGDRPPTRRTGARRPAASRGCATAARSHFDTAAATRVTKPRQAAFSVRPRRRSAFSLRNPRDAPPSGSKMAELRRPFGQDTIRVIARPRWSQACERPRSSSRAVEKRARRVATGSAENRPPRFRRERRGREVRVPQMASSRLRARLTLTARANTASGEAEASLHLEVRTRPVSRLQGAPSHVVRSRRLPGSLRCEKTQ